MVDFNNPRNRLNKQHAIYFEYKNLENERETGFVYRNIRNGFNRNFFLQKVRFLFKEIGCFIVLLEITRFKYYEATIILIFNSIKAFLYFFSEKFQFIEKLGPT